MSSPRHVPALVLGGGPAGSTVAHFLAKAGLETLVLERETFPRFHIGESLLPASVELFEKLGIHDEVRERFVHKPGGKWFYGERPLYGRFENPDKKASFHDHRYSYMVDRAEFDAMLLEKAQSFGAKVEFQADCKELIFEGERVRGVAYQDPEGNRHEVTADWVYDCTGLSGFLSNRLGIRSFTDPKRMAVYAHYEVERVDPELCAGWFVGEQLYDGWIWLIPLGGKKLSIGVVASNDEFRRAKMKPEEFLDHWVENALKARAAMGDTLTRIDDVRVTGNMGCTTTRMAGDGWVLVGDAGYFIDPCWSSGVHLALKGGEMVADIALAKQAQGKPLEASDFDGYEAKLRHHERKVSSMVEAFYLASRNPSVGKFITTFQQVKLINRKAVTFFGGDFTENSGFIWRWFQASRVVDWFTRNGWAVPEPLTRTAEIPRA